jgi:hypothetical protein
MTRSFWSRPVLALVVLVILFGHDALMAADPHGRDSAHHADRETGAVVLEAHCHEPEGTRTVSPDWPLADAFSAMVPTDAVLPPHRELDPVTRGPAPGYPPGVRRAFLQVYLN